MIFVGQLRWIQQGPISFELLPGSAAPTRLQIYAFYRHTLRLKRIIIELTFLHFIKQNCVWCERLVAFWPKKCLHTNATRRRAKTSILASALHEKWLIFLGRRKGFNAYRSATRSLLVASTLLARKQYGTVRSGTIVLAKYSIAFCSYFEGKGVGGANCARCAQGRTSAPNCCTALQRRIYVVERCGGESCATVLNSYCGGRARPHPP